MRHDDDVASARARRRISAACPSCSAPMVSTTAEPADAAGAGGRELGAGADQLGHGHRSAPARLGQQRPSSALGALGGPQQPGGQRPVGGQPGQRQVRARTASGARSAAARRGARRRCRRRRATTGPVSAASPKRSALSSAAPQQRREQPRRVRRTPAARSRSIASCDQRDQVVRAVRERRVVERRGRLGDPLPARRPSRRPAPRRPAAARRAR